MYTPSLPIELGWGTGWVGFCATYSLILEMNLELRVAYLSEEFAKLSEYCCSCFEIPRVLDALEI